MPKKKPIRSQSDRRLEIALLALRDALNATGAPWSIIGGIAVIAHGVRRMTTDIDAVIEGGAVTLEHLIATLGRHDVVPRIPDAELDIGAVRRAVEQLSQLAEAPELVAGLDAVIERAHAEGDTTDQSPPRGPRGRTPRKR